MSKTGRRAKTFRRIERHERTDEAHVEHDRIAVRFYPCDSRCAYKKGSMTKTVTVADASIAELVDAFLKAISGD